MAKTTPNTFTNDRDRARALRRQSLLEHLAVVVILSIAILGLTVSVALTGPLSQIV